MSAAPRTQKRSVSKPSAFALKKGFFEIPYIVNSPRMMIEGFKKMPFIDFNEAKQSINAKTPHLNIVTYYRDLEEGLFLVHSEAKFKSNVSFKHRYDKAMPSEYYCLSFRIDLSAGKSSSLVNGTGYAKRTWLIFKPGAKVNHHHFKGSSGKYFSLYFTRRWMEDHLYLLNKNSAKILKGFLAAKHDHLILPRLPGGLTYNYNYLAKLIVSYRTGDKKQTRRLKKEAFDFLAFFINKLETENINERHFKLSNLERLKVLQAERILQKHLYKKFPGIAFIAAQTGLSETKLKECFKTMYEKTLFHYFQSIQMERAAQLIAAGKMSIARVAGKFSYENAGKFSAAFKARQGRLPSHIGKD